MWMLEQWTQGECERADPHMVACVCIAASVQKPLACTAKVDEASNPIFTCPHPPRVKLIIRLGRRSRCGR